MSNAKIMKLKGLLGDIKVVVMIDLRATHNFISLAVMEKVGLVVSKSGSSRVCLCHKEKVYVRRSSCG